MLLQMDKTDNDSESGEAIVKREKRNKTIESKFAPCIKVVLNDGSKHVMVPIDKLSSDNQRSILIAKARKFVEDQLERLSVASLTPAEVRDLVKAVSDVDSLQREQYVTAVNNRDATSLGRGLGAVVREAAQGAAEGTANGFMAKMKAMDDAAKKAIENTKAVDV
jgi:hypothetical protein